MKSFLSKNFNDGSWSFRIYSIYFSKFDYFFGNNDVRLLLMVIKGNREWKYSCNEWVILKLSDLFEKDEIEENEILGNYLENLKLDLGVINYFFVDRFLFWFVKNCCVLCVCFFSVFLNV